MLPEVTIFPVSENGDSRWSHSFGETMPAHVRSRWECLEITKSACLKTEVQSRSVLGAGGTGVLVL